MNISFADTAELRKRLILTTTFLLLVSAVGQAEPNDVFCKETVIAGSPKDFVEVRHVVIKGTNFQIGKKIAEIAKKNNPVMALSGLDSERNRMQRTYMEQNYPLHYERMKGAAATLGWNLQDDSYDFSGLLVQMELPGITGCSAVFYPAPFTETGNDVLSRNLDFSTRTLQVTNPKTGEKPALVSPYVFEIYPDKGYASLYISAYEYLGGVLDGINSQGLAVAVLAELEAMGVSKPTAGVGMNEILCMRYLLDTCKDVEQAKEALLSLKHFYIYIPCHYLIADKSGKSFIFEFSPQRDKTFITDGDGPQCITNHLVYKYINANAITYNLEESNQRIEILRKAVSSGAKFNIEQIKEINGRVAVPPYVPQDPQVPPMRTLWHSIYDLDEGRLSVKFYLGEEPDPKDKSKAVLKYTEYIGFQLSAN
jgi:penicillin V acylase-like amidase (Ntn superfamily)